MRRTENFQRFNHSQLHALDTCRNLAVRANAGSGKTSVIVERIVQLLAKSWDEGKPLELSTIVAITFTRKAAAELQERLADSFKQLSFKTSDAQEQDYWTARADELPRATVGTIDSFCARILREFGLLEQGLGRIEPDFRPLEGYEERVLKREAIDRVLNRLSSAAVGETDASEWAQVEACHWWAVEEGYASLIRHLEILLNHFVDPETIIQAHHGLEPAVWRVDEEWAVLPVVRQLHRERDTLLVQLEDLVREIAERTKASASLTELREILAKVVEALRAGNQVADDHALRLLTQALLTKDRTPRKKMPDRLAPLQDTWCPLLRTFDFDYEGEVRAREAADRLVRLLEPVHTEYLRLCQAANRFDYLTLARRTRDLLKNHPEVRKQLKSRYRYVMIDEFQDTNELQWEIISCLVGSGPDCRLDKDRLFLVGDPQQSIYRFRYADVSIFTRVEGHIRHCNQKHGHACRPTLYDGCSDSMPSTEEQRLGLMPLAENYRSLTPMPLALMDRVFRHVFDAQAHGLDLEQNAFEIRYQPLTAGLPANPNAAGEVRYVIPGEQEEDESDEATVGEQEEATEAGESLGCSQVRAVVDQLIALHGQPKYTLPKDQARTLEWRDMAVLLPSRTVVLTELEKEFRKRRVPFVVTKGIGFWQRQEVRDVVNLAASLVGFGEELPLFAVLRSPVGQLDNAEILFLSQLGMGSLLRGLNHVLFVETDLAVDETGPDKYRGYVTDRWRKLPTLVRDALDKIWHAFSAESKDHLGRIARRLGNGPPGSWRRRVDRMAHADLLQRCLEESGAYAIYAAQVDGELMLANLDRLFALIRAEEAQSSPGLSPLARWLSAQMDDSFTEEQATLLPGSNAVQIMTVHAAKGLEFPVVAVMKMEREVDRPPNHRLLVKSGHDPLAHASTGPITEPNPGTVAVKVRHPRRPRELYTPCLLRTLQQLDLAQQLAESRRLFYVAATRAQERLLLAGRQSRRRGHAPESWQKWFKEALGIGEEHTANMAWEDPALGQNVQIITGVSVNGPVGKTESFIPDEPVALDYIHERPQTPTIATTSLELMRQKWQQKPWEWWLKYRLHLDPHVKLPGGDLPSGEGPSGGGQLGTVIGTLVHRLFEMAGPLQQQGQEAFRRLLEAMAAALLVSPSALDAPAEESPILADPEMIRIVVAAVEQIWRRLHVADGRGEQVRDLLEAGGEAEVPFVLKLGRWQISGRYDKLLTANGGFEIVDWKTDKEDDPETILRRHEPQMRLYALALHRAGLAALVNGKVRVHLAMLHPMLVGPLTFSPTDLEAFGDELTHELQQMDAYEPNAIKEP